MKHWFNRNFFYYIAIIAISLLGITRTIHQKNISLTAFENFHFENIFLQSREERLLANQRVVGEFKSKENNLGIVAIKFDKKYKSQNGLVTFKIKEKGKNDWYYENTYNAKEFEGYDFFPFGFPIISGSKNKYYSIELVSKNGNETDAVGINIEKPVVISKYQFTKSELFGNKELLLTFSIKKLQELLQIKNVLYILFITIIFLNFPYLLSKFDVGRYIGKNLKSKKRKEEIIAQLYIKPILNFFFKPLRQCIKLLSYFYNWLAKE